ncbi:hypothetical protein IKF15_00950 [Candidatus Saccharibacteria bacterium]|nr:hypothetical protein [Candidatus Saccharibacteria bacterium]
MLSNSSTDKPSSRPPSQPPAFTSTSDTPSRDLNSIYPTSHVSTYSKEILPEDGFTIDPKNPFATKARHQSRKPLRALLKSSKWTQTLLVLIIFGIWLVASLVAFPLGFIVATPACGLIIAYLIHELRSPYM